MNIFKRIKAFVAGLLEGDIRNDYKDDGRPYYVLSEPVQLLQSSVKGDFRLYKIQDGFCSSWRNQVVGRTNDGNLLWQLKGWGRCLAVSQDMTRIVAAGQKSLGIFNAMTGHAISEAIETEAFLDYILWLPDDRILATDCKKIYLFDELLNLKKVFEGEYIIEEGGFIGGIFPDPQQPYLLTILDVNNRSLKKVDLIREKVLKDTDADGIDQLFCSQDNRWLWATVSNGVKLEEIKVYDNKKLRERHGLPFKGKEGLRFANQFLNDFSYHSWIPLPALSPNRENFLVNDNSGLLWLIDARTGDKRRIFKRELLQFVYAIIWLDDESFVALLNDGMVAKMNVRAKELVFLKSDFDSEP